MNPKAALREFWRMEYLKLKKGMGGHQSKRMGKDEWITPPDITLALGPFDLDPCAAIEQPWTDARQHYTVELSGLTQPWHGTVWLNPPYGSEIDKWMARMAEHNNGIALIFARTETRTFHQYVWNCAKALFFFHGRLYFHHVDGSIARHNAGAPSVLVAYGDECAERLSNYGEVRKGKFIEL